MTTEWPWASSYWMVLGRGDLLWARYPCSLWARYPCFLWARYSCSSSFSRSGCRTIIKLTCSLSHSLSLSLTHTHTHTHSPRAVAIIKLTCRVYIRQLWRNISVICFSAKASVPTKLVSQTRPETGSDRSESGHASPEQ